MSRTDAVISISLNELKKRVSFMIHKQLNAFRIVIAELQLKIGPI